MSDSNNIMTSEPLKVYTSGGTKLIEKFSAINEHHGGRAYQRKLIEGKWEKVRSDGGVERVAKDLVLKNKNGSSHVNVPAGVAGYVKLIPSSQSGGYGNLAQITDQQGDVIARFAHLNKFNPDLKSGQWIDRGMSLGIQGTTGRSTGIHLHAEMPAADWSRYIEDTIKGRFVQDQTINESISEFNLAEIAATFPILSGSVESIKQLLEKANNQDKSKAIFNNSQMTAFFPLISLPAIPPAIEFFVAVLTGVIAGLAVNSITETAKSALSSGQLTNAMSNESQQKLISHAERMNKLVDIVNKAEEAAKSNPTQKEYHLKLAAVNRKEISKVYTEMANIMSDDLRNIRQNNPKMVEPAQEVIRGLRESALKVQKIGASLSEFHPQNIRSEHSSPEQPVATVSLGEAPPVAIHKSIDQEKNILSNSTNYSMIALLINARADDMKSLGLDVKNSAIDLDTAIVCYAQSNNLNPDALLKQSPTYQALSATEASVYKNNVIDKAQAVMTINAKSPAPTRATETQR